MFNLQNQFVTQISEIKNICIILLVVLTACDRIIYPPDSQDEKWSFVVFGDTRGGYEILSKLSENIATIEPTPRAAFCCGDLVNISTGEAEWISFGDAVKPVAEKIPLFIVRGNHDGNDTLSERYFRQLSGLSDPFYYTHCEENTLFIILDTYIRGEVSAILGEQLQWLQKQLDSASTDTSFLNVFIFMHHPLYPQGKHAGENLVNADEVHQLFLDCTKVRAIFSGHDHMFNKYEKDGVIYITTGGGGAPLYSGYGGDYYHFVKVTFYEDPLRINIKTIGLLNETIEDFDL